MRVDNLWEREAYNQSHPKQSHRKRFYQCKAQAWYPHKRHDAWHGKVQPGHEQSGWHNLQTRCRPISANHQREEPSGSLEYPSRTLPTHHSDKHLLDHLQGHQQEAVWLQERLWIDKSLPSLFRQGRRSSDRHLFLHSPKHRNVLSCYYTDEYRDGILGFGVSNSKRLERQEHKPDRDSSTNHQALQIHEGKRKG